MHLHLWSCCWHSSLIAAIATAAPLLAVTTVAPLLLLLLQGQPLEVELMTPTSVSSVAHTSAPVPALPTTVVVVVEIPRLLLSLLLQQELETTPLSPLLLLPHPPQVKLGSSSSRELETTPLSPLLLLLHLHPLQVKLGSSYSSFSAAAAAICSCATSIS